LLIEAVPEQDDWDGFWDDLAVLHSPVRRHATRRAEKRRSL
jgi:hypothetical protein